MKYFLLYLFSITTVISLSQNKEYYNSLAIKYPDKSLIETLVQKKTEITVENGKLKIITKSLEESVLLKDDAINYAQIPLYSSSFIKTKNITAKTLVPKGKGYKTVINDNVEVKSNNSSSSFYDDQKKHLVNFSNVEKGAIRVLSYETVYEEPHFFGNEFLCDYVPVEKFDIEIKCSKMVDLEIKFFNADEFKNQLTITEDKNFKIYKLVVQNTEGYKHFSGSPGYKWYLPHILMYVKSYNNEKENVDFLSSPKSLHNWYSSLVKHLAPITNQTLKNITDSITNNAPTEIDKVKNIFYWVQKNIKYVAFEDGLGGFIPRDASLVHQKKYGDCKDMAFLIYSMLRYKNIDAYLTWIGSRDLPYNYSQVPSPLTDNHMIACYKQKNGNYVFLDATDKQLKYGTPSAFTQGKQGLIGTTEMYLDTAYVPIMPANNNIVIDSTFLNLENNEIKGQCKNYNYGYNRIDYIENIENLTQQKKQEYYKTEYEKGSNKFFIDNIVEYPQFNDSCAKFIFDFTIKDYTKKIGNELFINLNIEKNVELYNLDKTFTTPYVLPYKYVYKYVKILNIPANYKVAEIPANYLKKETNYQFSINYKQTTTQLINTVEIEINTMLIPITEIPKWNNFVADYQKQTKQIVLLKSN